MKRLKEITMRPILTTSERKKSYFEKFAEKEGSKRGKRTSRRDR